MKKILVVGIISEWSLEQAYVNALKGLGFSVSCFDINDAEKKHVRLGKFGSVFHEFVQVDSWVKKANKDLFFQIKSEFPDVLMIFGQSRVLTGLLAQIKTSYPSIKLVHIWPDPFLNLNSNLVANLRFYDLVCSYSKEAIKIFTQLGAENVTWLPFAGNPELHGNPTKVDEYICDLSFVGMWRPERELALVAIVREFPHLNVKIWGPLWERAKDYKLLKSKYRTEDLRSKNYANAIFSSTISLNVMDDTNYPSANMRFFEIPMSKGFQLCNHTPEMAELFVDNISVKYFNNNSELLSSVEYFIKNNEERNLIVSNSHNLILDSNTYSDRAQTIVNLICDDKC